MSLEVDERRLVALRALAHPLRLRMLSLLTGAAMSAAELARELGVSQALASYHLRQLADAEAVELAEERSRRGGKERRYRYRVQPSAGSQRPAADYEGEALFIDAIAGELRRRGSQRAPEMPVLAVDAELWVRPEDWEEARQAIARAATALHESARQPHEPGAMHVNATVVMFPMVEPGAPAASSP
jgi:DNA-binding transcriptional ArsR family regulator